jgi:hypothetical protein
MTLLGIVTLVRPEQLPNAANPMLVTLLGIVMWSGGAAFERKLSYAGEAAAKV